MMSGPPLSPSRDDPFAPDYDLDHGKPGGFNSHENGCLYAQEEAIRELEELSGHECAASGRLDQEDFDTALIEGEAWGDLWNSP